MRYLLDTHSLLWFLSGDAELTERARRIIENPDHDILASIASLWEIATKHSLGKLKLAQPFEQIFPHQLEINTISLLGVRLPHVTSEEIPILSADDAFDDYGVERIW